MLPYEGRWASIQGTGVRRKIARGPRDNAGEPVVVRHGENQPELRHAGDL
jgi:hypothetical protein